ncbi:YSIRK-type signal peptide-containing protein [Aerococcaceae bacterium NML160702]|nr:YSIRK-type signal peptide-containing protein [Aerococcaceae bacterium NML160702]
MSRPPRRKIGQNILKFSIRKLSIGVTSAVIGSFILGATPLTHDAVAFAETNRTTRSLTYHYVAESELSATEKTLLQSGLPQDNLQSEQTYYFVYRSERTLPETGDSELDAMIASLGGIALMVVAVKFVKGNKKVIALVLISTLGQSIVINSVSAVQPQLFSHLTQTFTLNAGDTLPTPTDIEGYSYLGYIVGTLNSTNVTTNSVISEANKPHESHPSSVPTDEQKTSEQLDEGGHRPVEPAQPVLPEKEGSVTPPSTDDTVSPPPNDDNAPSDVPVTPPTEPAPSDDNSGTMPPNGTEDSTSTDNEGTTPPPATDNEGDPTNTPAVDDNTSSGSDAPSDTPTTPPVDTSTEPAPSDDNSGTTPPNGTEDSTSTDNEGTTPPPATDNEGDSTDTPAVDDNTSSGSDAPSDTPTTPLPLPPNKGALEAVINENSDREPTDYSEESWSIFVAALEASVAVHENPGATQEQIDQATTQLVQAMANLSVDKTALDMRIKDAQTKVEGDYSPESWAALSAALSEADAVNTSSTAKQSAINASATRLSEALSALTVNKQGLDNLIKDAQTKVEGDYSPESWLTLSVALSEATEVNVSSTSKQSAINASATKLSEALSALTVNKQGLDNLIKDAQTKVEGDYSPESWAALSTALSEATEVNVSSTSKQSAINASATRLSEALSALTVNKQGLDNLIKDAQTKVEGDYSPESWAALSVALSEATDVNTSSTSKQSAINASATKLSEALSALTVNKQGLDNLIKDAQTKVEGDYSPESWASLSTILQEATGIYSDNSAKQSQVNASMLALVDALKQLSVNKQPLEAKMAEREGLNPDHYTTASWQQLMDVIANARRVKADADVKQSALNEEEARVAAALAALQRLRTQPTIAVTDTASSNLSKTATISHTVADPDDTYVRGHVNIYKGGVFFRRVPIVKGTPTEIADLDYDTPYELETEMVYDIGNGEQETKLSERQAVELTLKKIAIKDAKAVSLFGLEGNEYRKLLSLAEVPKDLTHYYVTVESEHQKEWRLPVKAITEEMRDGEAVYRVTVAHPELVEDKGATYESDYNFYVAKHTPQDGLYTSFTALIDAIQANPTGNFILGANLSAAGKVLASTAASYVMNDFSGQLIGESNGKQFAIFDLAAPLFNKMVNATVRNLDLKHVNIATLDHTVGALAKQATDTTINDVAVEGTIVASRTIGGLLGKAEQAKISNVAFTGAIQALSDQGADSFVGGLVGELHEGNLDKGYVDADIRVNTTSKNHKVGMIIGRLHGTNTWATVNQVYAKGSLYNKGTNGQVGGLLGSTYVNGILRNAVTEAQVVNGNTVYGDTAYTTAKVHKESVFAVEQETNAVKDQWTTYITPEEAQAKLTAMGITATVANTGSLVAETARPTAYWQVVNATADRSIAYYNTLKLLPFYNKEYIVKLGNKIATTDKLYTVPLLSITPLKDGALVTDLGRHKEEINHIWLHFADGTIEKRTVTFKENFGATGIAEYRLADTEMLYTPEWLQPMNQQLVDQVVTLLSPLEYEGDEVWTALGGTGVRADQMNGLYLKDAFNAVKDQLATAVASVLGTSSVNMTDEGILNYIEQNKAQLLLGLSYVNRWYNINFGDTNIKELALYRQDFFGRSVDTLRWLVEVGSQGLHGLNPINNHELNPLIMGVHHDTVSIREYLNVYRNLFAKEQSESEWFKATTKAYIAEGKSMVNEQAVGISDAYEKLNTTYRKGGRTFDYRNMLLPLLTLSDEGVYIISTMSTITFGAFDKYVDTSLKTTNPETYAQKVTEFKAVVDREARKQGEHFAAWYRIALPSVRDRLLQGLPVWDSLYNHNNTVWAEKFDDNTTLAVREFFGPTGNWHGKVNNSEAYSNGTVVAFVVVGALDQHAGKGSSIFTHEQIHNFDSSVYFGGHKRRPGHSAESFAEGLLQAPRGDGNRIRNSFGFNFIQDGEHPTDFPEYNATPRRFQNADDLKTYMHGVLDVVYMLDYAEAEAIRTLPKEQQRNLLTKLAPQPGDTPDDAVNRNDFFRNFTEEEWNALNLTSIDDFVDNSVALKRFFRDRTRGLRNNEWDAYVKVPLFSPFYSLEENPSGTSGGYTFRRTAFELLAHKGYEQGFIPYVSNQYAKEAAAANLPLSDSYIVRKVLGNQYADLKSFKKAMFKERIDKLPNLKAVGEVEVQLGLETKRYQLDSFANIQQAITELTQSDATKQTNHVQKLKEAIFKQYLKQTDEFRHSIFNNQ